MDIRRQRHLPQFVDDLAHGEEGVWIISLFPDNARRLQLYNAPTSSCPLKHLSLQARSVVLVVEEDTRALAQPAPRPNKGLPAIAPQIGPLGQQQDLHGAPC